MATTTVVEIAAVANPEEMKMTWSPRRGHVVQEIGVHEPEPVDERTDEEIGDDSQGHGPADVELRTRHAHIEPRA